MHACCILFEIWQYHKSSPVLVMGVYSIPNHTTLIANQMLFLTNIVHSCNNDTKFVHPIQLHQLIISCIFEAMASILLCKTLQIIYVLV